MFRNSLVKSFLQDCDPAALILLHTVALTMSRFCHLPLHAYFNQINVIASECDVADECPTKVFFFFLRIRLLTSDVTWCISKMRFWLPF